MKPESLADRFVSHQKLIIGLVVAVTIPSLFIISRSSVPSGILESFASDSLEYKTYREFSGKLGGGADGTVIFITEEGESVFTPATLDAIRAAANEIAGLPFVIKVYCLHDVPRPGGRKSIRDIIRTSVLRSSLIRGELPEDRLSLRPIWPKSKSAQRRVNLDAVEKSLLEEGTLTGGLVGKNGRNAIFVIQFDDSRKIDGPQLTMIRSQIPSILQQHGLGAKDIYAVGLMVTESWMMAELESSIQWLLPIGALVLCLTVFLLFRTLKVVLLTVGIAAISIIWSLAVVSLVFGHISVMVGAVPLLVCVLGSSDTIHFISCYFAELKNGKPHRPALASTFRHVGAACFLTSLTTFIGLISLVVSPAATMRHFAVGSAVGVSSALLLTIVIVPIALDWWKPQGPRAGNRFDFANWILNQVVGACRRMALSHPAVVAAIGCLLIVLSGVISYDTRLDPNFANRFPASHPLRKSIAYVDEHLSGSQSAELFVIHGEGEQLTPEVLRKVIVAQSEIEEIPGVTATSSVADLAKAIGDEIDFDTQDKLPPTTEATSALIALIHRQMPDAIDASYARESGVIRIQIGIRPTSFSDLQRITAEIEQIADRVFGGQLQHETSGTATLLGQTADRIVRSQYWSFLFCSITVFLIILIATRSFRLGLISILPNAFSLCALATIVSLQTDVVDSDIFLVAIVGVCLAVDDTIHFLHRFQQEMKSDGDVSEAVSRTYQYSGAAVIRTTVCLSVGLLPFALSGYFSIWILGSYLVMLLLAAVVGDLLLLPALLLIFVRDREPTNSGMDESPANTSFASPTGHDRHSRES